MPFKNWFTSRAAGLFLLNALSVFNEPALAEPERPPPNSIVPPRLKRDPGVSYPRAALENGFSDRVTVTLVLEITREGRLEKATIQGHAQPYFDRAALGAAEGLLFLPATKDGIPIPARILFRYSFEAPPPTLAGKIFQDETGLALSGATIVIRTASGSAVRLESAADGTFRNAEVPRGEAELTISAPGYEPQRVNLTLRPGRETHVEGRLVRRAAAAAEEPTRSRPMLARSLLNGWSQKPSTGLECGRPLRRVQVFRGFWGKWRRGLGTSLAELQLPDTNVAPGAQLVADRGIESHWLKTESNM